MPALILQVVSGPAAQAATDLEQAITSLVHGVGEDHPETRESRNLLALAGT